MSSNKAYRVLHNGTVEVDGLVDYDYAWLEVFNRSGHSVEFAMRHHGWSIEEYRPDFTLLEVSDA